ncbi:uncharacterized protein LOC128249785 isoform X2 [Octopus bimaculoides]|uniref:uncharacterized protein LOC128249785 isoform X2 n=1 Tax=Octopus bimaculoides TaxID=37653 RepID=UPI0022E8BA5A|nr:uncharacterized protein LOC128249785 isoform X2 [Octopus bimaculoides]
MKTVLGICLLLFGQVTSEFCFDYARKMCHIAMSTDNLDTVRSEYCRRLSYFEKCFSVVFPECSKFFRAIYSINYIVRVKIMSNTVKVSTSIMSSISKLLIFLITSLCWDSSPLVG